MENQEFEKLPKEFKTKWITALRSGDYDQGTSGLHDPEANTYCCIGVACKIQGNKPLPESIYMYDYDDYNSIPSLLLGSNGIPQMLASMNDGTYSPSNLMTYKKRSFDEIADFIEENL